MTQEQQPVERLYLSDTPEEKEVLRVYCDTSVFGGCYDEEFMDPSRQIFNLIHAGEFVLVLSDITLIELRGAPEAVRLVLDGIPYENQERIAPSEEIDRLRDAYLSAAVVGFASRRDAAHIAAASVACVDMIVSWNFKHIVHFDKIRGYHEVNMRLGYPPIPIYCPREVV